MSPGEHPHEAKPYERGHTDKVIHKDSPKHHFLTSVKPPKRLSFFAALIKHRELLRKKVKQLIAVGLSFEDITSAIFRAFPKIAMQDGMINAGVESFFKLMFRDGWNAIHWFGLVKIVRVTNIRKVIVFGGCKIEFVEFLKLETR